MKPETQSVPEGAPPVDSVLAARQREAFRDSVLLARPYQPPPLLVVEEVEIGGGYHGFWVVQGTTVEESDWSEPYKKSGIAQYRRRIVRVPYPPPTVSGIRNGSESRE